MAGSWRKARWRICGGRPAPVTRRWKIRSSRWSAAIQAQPTLAKPALTEARSPHDQSRHGRLVRATRDAAGMAGSGVAVVGRPAPARLYRDAGTDRVRRVHARLRLPDTGPLGGFCRSSRHAPAGDDRGNLAVVWVADAVAGIGGGDARLLCPRRPRSDPVVISVGGAAVRGAHR